MGDTGKSYALLSLHQRVAFGSNVMDAPIFGGRVKVTGTAVMITAEDDAGEVHRRLAALDERGQRFGPNKDRMIVVPLPSAGGPQVFWKDDRKKGLVETDRWKRLCDQLTSIKDLRVVTLDPLASFAHVALNEDPAAGAFVCASIGRLASETGATTFVAHHMKKTGRTTPIESLSDAREAIRGSTALVDGLRLAYALWPAEEKRGKAVCKELGLSYSPNRVVLGGVVKANGAARRIVSTYVRNEFGLLVDRTASLGAKAVPQEDMLEMIVEAVAAAARSGHPYTKTGATGLFEQKDRLPEELSTLSKHRLEALAQQAIDTSRVVKCLASGTTAKWLDVPGGDFAIGLGQFRKGMVEAWRAKAPKHDHKIFGRKLKTDKARHRDLAALGALISFRNRPAGVAEGVPAEDPAPIQTNWSLIPANDNQPPEDGFGNERAVEYEPSLDLIERETEHLPMDYRAEPTMLRKNDRSNSGALAARQVHGLPYGDAVEYGVHIDDEGKRHKTIIRIGRLKFSDGSQTERGHKLVMDAVEEADIRMPVGAMLAEREKSSRNKGGEADASGSNAHFRWMVPGKSARRPKKAQRKPRIDISKQEARQILAEAYANTPVLPEVRQCSDGFPYAPNSLRQLFIGGRKGKKGESGSQAWEDIFTQRESRETFNRALDAMQDEHVRVLTEAIGAKSLGELGERRGYRGRHAIDAGRRLLRAANDNFEEAMKLAEYAAEA
eukprot:g19944.t1